ncbi:NAD(P)H-dependent oxidoreductase [Streptomyces misionensis]|uniref:NAD(P)H-dependent oxidoreductase n=1 Tax=Streptomyces misionensis TaxID=67331 RepID=A0A5C6IY45_9ACTN|nr:NAD(P)H-dependent oxidoreductase [Streptomyces misionensis]TWV33801.1 NAD(P)H-dependent oxidoreductase [Streptomyces misionensis]
MTLDHVTIVGIGGSTRPGSSTEQALRAALKEIERLGARTVCLSGHDLDLPHYTPDDTGHPRRRRLVDLMASADGLVIATPAYHGGMSGLVKNALDHAEDLRRRPQPYFSARPVGCLATAYGAQGAASALASLRATVHALRGWPTPLGVAVDSSRVRFGPAGACQDPHTQSHLEIMARHITEFAGVRVPGYRQEKAS